MTSTEEQKYRVFSYFWEKGYFLTSGGKFGGDFLVYPGVLIGHVLFVLIVSCRAAVLSRHAGYC